MNTIRVHLPGGPGGLDADRSYDIRCGTGVLDSLGPLLRDSGARRAVVVADAAVAENHAAQVLSSLACAEIEACLLTVPAGEASKSVAALERLWEEFARLAIDRRTHVIAVGGGVVGDLAGFAAATFARGLSLWQVPTTLVAQVDSAIGGKTGINLPSGKNLVGAFWQPAGVISDIGTLSTLPDREFVSGLAEVVKYGVILDAEFFAWLEDSAAAVLARNPAALGHAVQRSATVKARVVEQDERETSGLRAALNYGHTFAHAYETAAGYGVLLHGEAVAIGMARAARLAERCGRIPGEIVVRQDRLLERFGLPITPPESLRDAERLLGIMSRDKKTLDGQLRFVLPSKIGHVDLVDGIRPEAVKAVLQG